MCKTPFDLKTWTVYSSTYTKLLHFEQTFYKTLFRTTCLCPLGTKHRQKCVIERIRIVTLRKCKCDHKNQAEIENKFLRWLHEYYFLPASFVNLVDYLNVEAAIDHFALKNFKNCFAQFPASQTAPLCITSNVSMLKYRSKTLNWFTPVTIFCNYVSTFSCDKVWDFQCRKGRSTVRSQFILRSIAAEDFAASKFIPIDWSKRS